MKVSFSDLYATNQTVEEDVIQRIRELIRSSKFIGGEDLDKFEEEFAAYAKMRFCAGCANGTDALLVALKSLNIGHGDTVLTVPNTFIATTEAINYSGADLDFIDVEEDYHTMDPEKLERYLKSGKGKRVKAVMPVHLYGHMADMKRTREIADEFKVNIIEDSAQAHGASLHGKTPGSWGDFATFSFFPGKNLGAFGDAGAIVTNNEDLFIKAKRIINHGRIKEKYTHEIIGTNARLDNLQACILRFKLRNLDELTAQRIKNAERYTEKLKANTMIMTPKVRHGAVHVYHLYVVKVAKRDSVLEELKKKEIIAGVHYPIPLHLQPAYKYLKIEEGSYPVSEKLSREVLSLPMWPQMEIEKIDHVADVLNDICS